MNDKDIFDLLANVGRIYLYGEGMWFLCSLFVVEIIAYYSDRNNKIIKLFMLIIVGRYYYEYIKMELPFKCDVSIYAIAGFYLGILLKSYIYENNINQSKLRLGLLLGLIASVLTSVLYYSQFPDVSLRIEHVVWPWYWIAAIFGILWIYCMAASVRISYLKKILMFIGENSLIFYCLNDAVLKLLKGIFFVILQIDLSNVGFIGNFILGILFVVMTVTIIFPFVKLINKHFPFVIGR